MLYSVLTLFALFLGYYSSNAFESGIYISSITGVQFEHSVPPRSKNTNTSSFISILDSGLLSTEEITVELINNNKLECFAHQWTKYFNDGATYICADSRKNSKALLREYNMNKKFVAQFYRRDPILKIHSALIVGKLSDTSRNEANNKLRKFFGHYSKHMELSVWSGVYTSPCPNSLPDADVWHSAEKIIGITMAHMRVLRDFYFRTKHSLDRNILIIFEEDAICGVPDCGKRALEEVRSFQADMFQLGWCYAGENDCGRCTHAYAVSTHGAAFLKENIHECSDGPIDFQIVNLKKKQLLTCAVPILSDDEKKSQENSWTKGFFVQVPTTQ